MFCRDMKEAREQAQANADLTGAVWRVFVDQSGNAQCERVTPVLFKDSDELFHPTRPPVGVT